ncbi:restriction endonuclease [Anabaena lutea]|uniref:Restriction endonuclease n=1 Tax=Anabaena lutea FACHB-196 TaxID=2692881 RepID=A0ABR8FLR3_9NOST|nr:restriction endonuclease [Anabaena lutea]MBD2571108.1 restriction endonuclease [Anabaena lutea FACHB-196]
MPTPSTSDLPKPKSWDEFEDIMWEIYTRRWQDPHAQRYGRSGQAQNGIDIYGQQNGSGNYLAVQCKRYQDNTLTQHKIEIEIAKAENFSSPISEYIIASTESRDTKIQDFIRDLNEKRKLEAKFPVNIVFWEDICSYLANENNHDLLKKYYSEWERIFTNQQQIEEVKIVVYPLTILVATKFCESVNYFGVFLNYFLADDLGHQKAEEAVNKTICTNLQSYDVSAIEAITNVFEKKDLKNLSNKGQLSWQEFLVTVFERIYTDCENLLLKYGGSINPELTIKLERIKDVSWSMIGFTNSNYSSSEDVRRRVYTIKFLKPYFLEVIEVRILAIKYISPSAEVINQPKVLPGEKLKGIVS